MNTAENKIDQLLRLKEYDLAKALYSYELETKQMWLQEYSRLIRDKEYKEAIALAKYFSAPRKILRQSTTEYILTKIQEEKYREAIQNIEEYPVDYFKLRTAFFAMPQQLSNRDWIKLHDVFIQNLQITSEDAISILQGYGKILKQHKNKQGSILNISAHDEVLLSGDLHGNTKNLDIILKQAELDKYPNRHLILQEIIHSRGILVNQCDFSFIEVLKALKYANKYPNRVHIILGNHDYNMYMGKETAMKKRRVNKYFERGLKKIFVQFDELILNEYKKNIIPYFPVAIEYGNIIFSHSNPNFKKFSDFQYRNLFETIPLHKNRHVAAIVEGRDHSLSTVEKYLNQTNAKVSIIGHEICRLGYEIPHAKQLIIDSCHPYGFYLLCKQGNYQTQSMLHSWLHPLQPSLEII